MWGSRLWSLATEFSNWVHQRDLEVCLPSVFVSNSRMKSPSPRYCELSLVSWPPFTLAQSTEQKILEIHLWHYSPKFLLQWDDECQAEGDKNLFLLALKDKKHSFEGFLICFFQIKHCPIWSFSFNLKRKFRISFKCLLILLIIQMSIKKVPSEMQPWWKSLFKWKFSSGS